MDEMYKDINEDLWNKRNETRTPNESDKYTMVKYVDNVDNINRNIFKNNNGHLMNNNQNQD
jgi:hypothetical protein